MGYICKISPFMGSKVGYFLFSGLFRGFKWATFRKSGLFLGQKWATFGPNLRKWTISGPQVGYIFKN
jgi:hypothetical protein